MVLLRDGRTCVIGRPPGIGQRLAFHGFSGNIPGFLRALIACANKSFTTQVVVHRLFEVLDGTVEDPSSDDEPWVALPPGWIGWLGHRAGFTTIMISHRPR
ncbi:hypothetical protein VB716_07185 [Synechococcus sp. CCY9201]|uniref:hypothetical protein n=1 Tax=Synechococcus sp. CCY9201 TaxID=174697 RepID=UPI002B21E502|nr:hypothetical protein [Synechococcus sp. CCY9201]MEA5474006.1 hypothetical protein [Synechococcus sp. CCY9201]